MSWGQYGGYPIWGDTHTGFGSLEGPGDAMKGRFGSEATIVVCLWDFLGVSKAYLSVLSPKHHASIVGDIGTQPLQSYLSSPTAGQTPGEYTAYQPRQIAPWFTRKRCTQRGRRTGMLTLANNVAPSDGTPDNGDIEVTDVWTGEESTINDNTLSEEKRVSSKPKDRQGGLTDAGGVSAERLAFEELGTREVDRLFSALEPCDVSGFRHKPGNLLDATALIGGTAVGAGILALPAATLQAGLLPSSVALTLM